MFQCAAVHAVLMGHLGANLLSSLRDRYGSAKLVPWRNRSSIASHRAGL